MKENNVFLRQSEEKKDAEQFCGFIGLIGRPNVGKSTLLNKLVGQKISITTHKAQTTRNRILGILTENDTQIIFIDTPGIHIAENMLNKKIVAYAENTLGDTDLILWIVQPYSQNSEERHCFSVLHPEDQHILQMISDKKKRTVLVLNKIDTLSKGDLLKSIANLNKLGLFIEIVPVSALKSTNLARLITSLKKYISPHPFYFGRHQVTDVSERFLAGEFVREEIFLRLRQEIPYSVAVIVEQFKEESKCIKIACVICVERNSQKGIIIGKKGEMLKNIGAGARKKIQSLLGNKVFLRLHVKVLKQWTKNELHLQSLGFK